MQEIIITTIICATVIAIFAICTHAAKRTKERQCLYDISTLIKTFNIAHVKYNSDTHEYELDATIKELKVILKSVQEMVGACWGNND